MDDSSRAQAVELIRALRTQVREMTTQLAGLQPLGGGVTTGRAGEMRTDAAALRRDIQEAEAHIDRLQRRYIDLASAVGALTRA